MSFPTPDPLQVAIGVLWAAYHALGAAVIRWLVKRNEKLEAAIDERNRQDREILVVQSGFLARSSPLPPDPVSSVLSEPPLMVQ